MLCLGDFYDFRPHISDAERKSAETYFKAAVRCLDERLPAKGHILLVLDNVTESSLPTAQQTDALSMNPDKWGPFGAAAHLQARRWPEAQRS